jgi:hypothetical protein
MKDNTKISDPTLAWEEQGEQHFQVSLCTTMTYHPFLCIMACIPYGCCCLMHYLVHITIHNHVALRDPPPDFTCLQSFALLCCCGASAEYASSQMMDKYDLVPRKAESVFKNSMCLICWGAGHAAGEANIMCKLCITSCKLAQVHHEIQYHNNGSARSATINC